MIENKQNIYWILNFRKSNCYRILTYFLYQRLEYENMKMWGCDCDWFMWGCDDCDCDWFILGTVEI